MINKERIERLRKCASFETCNPEMCDLWSKDDCRSILLNDAADAIEAADKRIAELEQERNKTVTAIFGEEQKWWENRCKELETERMELTAKCGRLEAQLPKEGEWITKDHWYYCSNCGHEMFFTGTFDEEQRYCYFCGAKMIHKYCDVVNGCVMCDVELCNGKEKQE